MSLHYITTAIVYPNSRIHVGWAWECLGADFLARARRALGSDTYFATGMDEHSLKVQKRAEKEGMEPQAFCDQMAKDIENVLGQMGMAYDRFIRTSDKDHHRVVSRLIQRSYEAGDIYRAKYEGHYCEGCEAYYTDKDLVDGLCPQHQSKTKWISEENFFFKLSKYEKPLLDYFEKNPEFLQPENRRNEIVNVIRSGLKDFSISRSNFTWGIPLPFEKGEVIYVWFDALINYLTAAGVEAELDDPSSAEAEQFRARWGNVTHIIGKDITRFHCVYWPAMLLSMGLPLPKRVFAHGFIHLKGERMSKSLGTGVTPDEVMSVTGPDPFRYYLLAENDFSKDGNFSWESLVEKANADLANDFGNLVNRALSMTRKYFKDEPLPPPKKVEVSKKIQLSFETLVSELEARVDAVDPSGYIQKVMDRSRLLNLFVNETEPWKLAKALAKDQDDGAREKLGEILYALLEGIRWMATALGPVLPFGMPKVFEQLQVSAPTEKGALTRLKWGEPTYSPSQPKPIYPRLELPTDS